MHYFIVISSGAKSADSVILFDHIIVYIPILFPVCIIDFTIVQVIPE